MRNMTSSQPDDATFARTDAEVRDLWRKRVKYDLLGLMAEKAKAKAADDKKAEDKKAAEEKKASGGDEGPARGTTDDPSSAAKPADEKSAG